MLNSKKLIAVAVTAILLVAATPLAAKLDGDWAGEGNGWCYTPDGGIIHAWETWQGTVDSGSFTGTWEDSDGNVGTFDGDVIALSITSAYCTGTWTWISPDGTIPIEMGSFVMMFYYSDDDETCRGTWSTPDAVTQGRMWGERIGG